MRKHLIKFLFLLIFNSTYSLAESDIGIVCKPRVPKIEFTKAVDIALKSFGAMTESSTVFVDSANLVCEKNKHYWLITLRKRDKETGQMMIKISMDGTTNTVMQKDG